MVFLLKTLLLLFCVTQTSWASIIDQQMIDRATTIGVNDHERLEYLYLQAVTAELMESSYRYASLSGKPISYELDNTKKLQRCRDFLPELEHQQQRVWLATTSDPDQYFLHLTTLSVLLVQMNLKMHRLGVELKELNSDVLATVMDKQNSVEQDDEQRKKDLEAKMKVLSDNIDSVFTNDSSNFLLTMEVRDNEGKKLPFFHKIAIDYYNMVSEGIVGDQMIIEIQQRNSELLLGLFKTIAEQTKQYLQTVWDHSCRQRKFTKRDSLARVGFYFKHHTLMDKVEASLEEDSSLLSLHQQLKEEYSQRIDPNNYQTSAKSFFGLLGVLTASGFLIEKISNKRYALPIIAVAGSAFTYHQVKILTDLRQQLEIGAFTSLNSYQQYRYFRDNTSVSKYTFSHLAAIALSLLFVSSKGHIHPAGNKDKAFVKGAVNLVGSLGTLFYIEGKTRGTFNPLKDENFSFNMLLTIGLDFAVGAISALTTMPYVTLIALTAATTAILSISTHVVMGRPMNWDRIVFDMAFISILSLGKAHILLTKVPQAISIPPKFEFASWMLLSLTSNVLGNYPYTKSTHYWLEGQREYGRLPINDGTTQYNIQPADLIKGIEKLIEEDNFTSESLIKLVNEYNVPT